jgi:hypothetical protein
MNFTLTRNSPHLNSHQPEQASESALNSRNNISETVKHLGGTGGPPIILDYSKENKLSVEILSLYEVFYFIYVLKFTRIKKRIRSYINGVQNELKI